jgi:hypothetical protein
VYASSAESVEQDIAVLTGGLKSTDNDDARDLAIALRRS